MYYASQNSYGLRTRNGRQLLSICKKGASQAALHKLTLMAKASLEGGMALEQAKLLVKANLARLP